MDKLIEWSVYAMLVAFTIFCTNIISDQYNVWAYMRWAGEMLK